MTTIQKTIDRAFGELGIVEGGDAVGATDAAEAMALLNQMMAQWKYSGRDFNWFPQDDLTETLPVPEWAEAAVVSSLAVKCAPAFRAPITSDLAMKSADELNIITRTLMNLNLESADMTHLPFGTYTNGNILTDTQ